VYEYLDARGHILYVGKSGGILEPNANWVDRLQNSHINTDWIADAVRVRVHYDLTEQEMWALEEVEIPVSANNIKRGEYTKFFGDAGLSANAKSASRQPTALFAIYAVPVRGR
jgi:hypothetical protein